VFAEVTYYGDIYNFYINLYKIYSSVVFMMWEDTVLPLFVVDQVTLPEREA
jgi:hypothetical protein